MSAAPLICGRQFAKLPFEGLILTVTLGPTVIIITLFVVIIITVTSGQMRRNLAANGHAQGHTAGRGHSGTVPRLPGLQLGLFPPCLACSMGEADSAPRW